MIDRLCRVIFCLCCCVPAISFSQVSNTGTAKSIAEEQDYAFAYGLFKDGLYQLAGEQFDKFVQNYPQSIKKVDATFLGYESRFQQQQFDTAAKLFARFVQEYPSSRLTDDAYLRLGESLIRLNRTQDAIVALKTVLDKFGDGGLAGEAAYWTGEAFVRDRDFDNAVKYYMLSYEHYPKNRLRDYALYAVGWAYQTEGKYQKALEEYERFSKEFPGSDLFSAAQVRRGECYYYMKEYRRAIQELTALRSSISVAKERGEADYLIGEAYYNLAEYGEAKTRYESFLKDYPDHSLTREVTYALGWCYLKLNDFAHAKQTFNRLVAGSDALAHAGLFRRGVAEKFLGDTSSALTTWKEVVRRAPRGEFSDNALYESGLVLYEGNKPGEAQRFFQQVVDRYPQSDVRADASRMVGECLVAAGNFKDARTAFASALADSNASFEAKSNAAYQEGWCDFKMKQYGDAVQAFSRFVAMFPKHPKVSEATFWRAESEYQLGQYTAAARDYGASSGAASSKREEALYGQGWSFYKLNDFTRAREAFRQLLSAFPRGSFVFDARLRLADCYFFSKDYTGAQEAYRLVVNQFPDHDGTDYASYQLGQAYYRSGKFNDAVAQFTGLRKVYPNSSLADDAQYAIGWIWFQNKQYAEAIKEFQTLIQAYPSSDIVPRAYYSIGDSHYNQQQYAQAEQAYREVLNRFPKSEYTADAISGIQYCLLAQGKQQEAVKVIDTFVKNHPGSDAVETLMLKKGEMFFSQKQYSESISEYRAFITKYPASSQRANAYYWIGKSYEAQNRLLDAAQAFRQAAAVDGASKKIRVQALLDLGEAYRSLKSYEKALSALAGIDSVDARSDLLPEASLARGRVFEAMGNVVGAHTEYNNLIGSYPATRAADEARLALARIYLDQENYPDGEQLARSVATSRTDQLGAEGQYLVGQSYVLRREWDNAITAFLRVRYIFPTQEEWLAKSYLGLGSAYEQTGDLRKARDAYQTVLKLENQKDAVAEAQKRLKNLERS